jgi:hypothetical protein
VEVIQAKNDTLFVAVRMGVLFRDCDPTKCNLIMGRHRRAGGVVYCKAKRDPTRMTFDYVDAMGGYVKSEQRDQVGIVYNNIIWDDGVERTHGKSMVAFDH